MKKLILTILLFTATVFGNFEISDGIARFLSPDSTRSTSIRPIPTTGINIDWIWPLGYGAAGQSLITDGSTNVLTWGASVTGHDILSVNHTDTVVNAVTRGSLIYGNATPKWDEL